MLNTLSPKPLKGLLFDLDGTLLDSAPDLAQAIDAMLEERGLATAGETRIRGWIGNGAAVLVCRALAFATGCKEYEIEQALQLSAHRQFLQHYMRCSTRFSRLYPGVLTALEHWQQLGIKMAVISNKPQQFIEPLLRHFEIAGYFQLTVGGDTLATKKPDPEPLFFACRQMNLAVDECVMVGDSRNDVDAARAAGMPVACVSYGYNYGQPANALGANWLVDNLEQLLD